MLVNTVQAANLLGVSPTRVRMLLKQKRIVGAYKLGKFWVIPLNDGMPVVSKGRRGPMTSFKSARATASSIIRINRQEVDRNYKQSKEEPVITVRKGDRNTYGHEVEDAIWSVADHMPLASVEINGPCRIVYSRDRTKFGARVWIETFSTVDIVRKDLLFSSEHSYLEQVSRNISSSS